MEEEAQLSHLVEGVEGGDRTVSQRRAQGSKRQKSNSTHMGVMVEKSMQHMIQ